MPCPNDWSCPKCKHGGADREHNRIAGKCRYAPKSEVATGGQAAAARKPQVAKSQRSSVVDDHGPVPSSVGGMPSGTDSGATPLPAMADGQPVDPNPLADMGETDHILDNTPAPIPPVAQSTAVPPAAESPTKAKKPAVHSKNILVKETYEQLKKVSVDDVDLKLHENLRNPMKN